VTDYVAAWVQTWVSLIGDRIHREEGQDGMEYAVVAAVVIVAAALAYTNFGIGDIVTSALTKIKAQLPA